MMGAVTGAAVLGRFALLPPSRSRHLAAPRDLAIRFIESLDAEDRKRACVDYDNPLRQYHNRGVWGGGVWVNPVSLGWEQRRTVTDLFYAGLSEAGRRRVPNEYFGKWPGVHSMHVLLCGDPRSPPYQLVLTGPHLNLRLGGASREGAAFGGPLVYGDQRGDSIPDMPGNLYRFQLEIAQRLFRSLREQEQRLALQKTSPIQTAIQPQGSEGSFAGVEIARLQPAGRALARELIDAILSTYPSEDVAYAWECLEHNGGFERLFLSYYEDSQIDGSKRYQNFRLEGPAAVLYFRGCPHVHAFINITMNADTPLSVGEPLGNNPAVLEGVGVKRLFEAAMREQSGADAAYYDLGAVAGRLRKGPMRTGDIYALESWQDRVIEVEIKGSNLAPSLTEGLRARGIEVDPRRAYAVATTASVVDENGERLGKIEARRKGGMVRDAAIAYLKKRGPSGLG
jgi:Protein of unknown function (DUF3500)/5'-nucleotidase, C-terminal domain